MLDSAGVPCRARLAVIVGRTLTPNQNTLIGLQVWRVNPRFRVSPTPSHGGSHTVSPARSRLRLADAGISNQRTSSRRMTLRAQGGTANATDHCSGRFRGNRRRGWRTGPRPSHPGSRSFEPSRPPGSSSPANIEIMGPPPWTLVTDDDADPAQVQMFRDEGLKLRWRQSSRATPMGHRPPIPLLPGPAKTCPLPACSRPGYLPISAGRRRPRP